MISTKLNYAMSILCTVHAHYAYCAKSTLRNICNVNILQCARTLYILCKQHFAQYMQCQHYALCTHIMHIKQSMDMKIQNLRGQTSREVSLVDDQAVSSTNAVEEQVGHTMFPRRFIEAVANSVERTRSHLSIGESQLFAVPRDLDNMKTTWTPGKSPMPFSSI